jgi:hypothetical protein
VHHVFSCLLQDYKQTGTQRQVKKRRVSRIISQTAKMIHQAYLCWIKSEQEEKKLKQALYVWI